MGFRASKQLLTKHKLPSSPCDSPHDFRSMCLRIFFEWSSLLYRPFPIASAAILSGARHVAKEVLCQGPREDGRVC